MHVYRTLVGERYVDDAYVYRNVQTRTAAPVTASLGTPLPLKTAAENGQDDQNQ